jgi:hypothetical protein
MRVNVDSPLKLWINKEARQSIITNFELNVLSTE